MKITFKKKKQNLLDEKTIAAIIEQKLKIQEEKIKQFFNDLERNKEKQHIWDSLSARKKIKLLKYMQERGNHAK